MSVGMYSENNSTHDQDFIECACSCNCGNKVKTPNFSVFVSKIRCEACSDSDHIARYPLRVDEKNIPVVSPNITKIVELDSNEEQIAQVARKEIQKELWINAWEKWQSTLPEKFKQASINNDKVQLRLDKLIQGRSTLDISGVLIHGLVGRGKTWLAIGYANDAIRAGVLHPSEVIFGTESDLLASASNSKFGEVEAKLQKLTSGKYKCIIIDDIGRGTWLRDDMRPKVFSLVFDKQWSHGNMVIVTTNLTREELGRYIGAAAMERLLAMCGYAPDVVISGVDKRRERTSLKVKDQHESHLRRIKSSSDVHAKVTRSNDNLAIEELGSEEVTVFDPESDPFG